MFISFSVYVYDLLRAHRQTGKHQSGQILRYTYLLNLKMPLFADILQLQVNSKGGLEYQNAKVQQSRALQEPREHRDETCFLTKQLAKYLDTTRDLFGRSVGQWLPWTLEIV